MVSWFLLVLLIWRQAALNQARRGRVFFSVVPEYWPPRRGHCEYCSVVHFGV